MSRAEEIVALQAELLEEFHIPDPDAPYQVRFGVQMGGGGEYVVPVSKMGRIVDLVLYGDVPDWKDYRAGSQNARTVSPAVAYGLSVGRTYRVQENMTAPIVERADALPAGTVFGLGDGEIQPPRPDGFAWFEELVPYRPVAPGHDVTEPGIGVITWSSIANANLLGEPVELLWLVVVWDDIGRSAWWKSGEDRGDGYGPLTGSGSRFVPVTATVMRPGETLNGTPIPPRKLGDKPIRNPSHVVAALWQMLGETVPSGDRAEQESETIDRRTQRRARRAGMSERSEVTTVVLRQERRPVQNPGSGQPRTERVWVEPYDAWRWVGSGDNRRRVRRRVAGHWSVNNEELPIRQRRVVSELRR